MDLNLVALVGRVCHDPELRETRTGRRLAVLRLALNRTYHDPATGRRQQQATFIDAVLWGSRAEAAARYLRKGREVYVRGYLEASTWTDAQGMKRTTVRVQVEDMDFVDAPPADEVEDPAVGEQELP